MAESPAPRRSQRDKKTTQPFVSVSNVTGQRKRKRNDGDAEEDAGPENDAGSPLTPVADDAEEEDEEEEDYSPPKPKATGSPGRKGKAKHATKPKGPPPAKKIRTTKPVATKVTKATTRRGRKPKEGGDAYDAAQVERDTKITADNPLFNAIMNPSAALQSTAEDFLESLDQTPGPAQADLINLILRSCGCNDSVDADEVVDYDGVVDALDNFTEGLKQDNSPVYPLTSRLPAFKKFRKSLSEFIERLIASSADLGALYATDLMATLQTWVIAMSSSQIRSFRHTATVVALEVETALCDVAAACEKEAEVVGRQREGEKKRKASNKGGGARLKELEQKAHEIRERRTKLAEFLKEFVDGVFVHRYRDLDPNIRAECVRAIGLWFRKYPGHFLDASYLRYVGWVLSDTTTSVRLEAVKALSGVYEQADYVGSLNHFTERFKPRLIEMATGDTELAVRVAVIQVLGAIDGHSLLEDEERENLCLLVFDEEPKVRRAVSQFVKGVWEETVEERLVGRNHPSEEERKYVGAKALAMLLVKWGKNLDKIIGEEELESDVDGEDSHDVGVNSRPAARKEVAALAMEQRGRTAFAVEALWDEVDPVSDWEGLLEVLLLDHSAAGEDEAEGSSRRPTAKGKRRVPDNTVDEAWRLEEVEESALLEVLVASIRRAKADVVGSKKGEEETTANDITRALIKGLPRLFVKHQTDQNRIADVLLIPTLMNLDLYLEMRMITSYISLWDDVTKQFLSHSSLNVLTHAMAAIRHFMDATSLSNSNSTKMLELEDELSSALRDAVAGRDEIEVASFTEDEVLSLGAICSRLSVLAGTRNLTAWMEEDEGGKQSSVWNIISALVERGRLGYKEEETMIEKALLVLTLHIIWKGKGLTTDDEPSPEEVRLRETLLSQRETLLEKLIEYAIGTQSNTVEGIKRAAFKNLLDLHVLFSSSQRTDADGNPLPTASVALVLDDEVQYRCGGYIQAEIERYAETLEVEEDDGEEDHSDEATSDEEQVDEAKGVGKQKRKKGKKAKEVDTTSRAHLEREYLFIDVVSTFLRAIRAGAIHVRHGAVLLSHYGCLGPSFDVCSKIVVDVLREEGMIHDHGDIVVTTLTQAMQEAYTLVLEGVVRDETNCVQLSKLLSACFVIRGSQLSIVRRLDSQYVVQIHCNLLTWISGRIGTYDKNKNSKALKTAILFFKALIPMLALIQSRDALKIKAHMDQALARAKIEVSPTLKSWEPQRAYDKRLSAALAKDKANPGANGRKGASKGMKSAANVSSDEDESEVDDVAEPEAPERPQLSQQRALRDRANGEHRHIQDEEEEEEEEGPTNVQTPKQRPRPRPTYRKKATEPQQDRSKTPTRSTTPLSKSPTGISPAGSVAASEPEVNGLVTPQPSRKRGRTEEPSGESMAGISGERENSTEPPLTPEGDMQIRRKRVRH